MCVLLSFSGLAVSQLVLSSRTVWVRCVNGDLARRYGISDRNPAGDYWKKIPGNANCLTGETGFMRVSRIWLVSKTYADGEPTVVRLPNLVVLV